MRRQIYAGCLRSLLRQIGKPRPYSNLILRAKDLATPAARHAATKSKRALELPISDLVSDLLARRRELGNAGWVFPANSRSGHVEEPRHYLEQVAKAIGIEISVHDLRRTFVSVAESTEMSVYALKALVNHALGSDVTAGYVQHSVERLRVPAQRVADELRRLCKIDDDGKGSNVVALR